MTIPTERTRAVLAMGEGVAGLLPYLKGSGDTVRIPRALLESIAARLRHYPTQYDMEETAKKLPELWG